MFNRDEVRDSLRASIATVIFEKKDGTERKMRCTLQESFLPTQSAESKQTKKDNENALAVWDLDNGGWRSFRIDSIKSITLG